MPNENASVCACGVVVDLPKSRSSSIVLGKLTILLPKSKGNKSEGKGSRKQHDDSRGPKNRTPSETGSSSSVTEPARSTIKSSKHEKQLNHSRRTRSADRAESHYTYIDSGSSILSGGIRENTIPEALYTNIPDTPNTSSANESGTSRSNSQSRLQPLYSAIPSMTSPPPTYDVAIAKTWQTGLPPTYEEYLCHKYAMMSRSHTPPPPWSDSTTTSSSLSNPTSSIQARRDLLASQPELREYLTQLTRANRVSHHQQHQQQQQQRQQSRGATCSAQREQQVRAQQRARAMPPRSQSESRAQQQRMAAMYEDAAFCMETTVLQSAFDSGQGFALCSLM
ncbi:uncharacterized protein [Linepithema humile]|uniref:uncharacterized protein n=1 Tax=Linepithema humile TaxID=83485 RepID=UPI00062342A6|nr:PREDICTED: putative protein TPRXL [Linepithema humile]